MIMSLVLSGRHNIGVDKYGKFMLDGSKNATKDVPFVRYRFYDFVESDIEYIKDMKVKFGASTHMVEVRLKDTIKEEIKMLTDNIENLAVYIYIPVDDEIVKKGFDEETLKLLETLEPEEYDRIMMKDNSDTMHLVSANRLKKQLSINMGIHPNDIGICGSPLSFGEESCLNAIRARDLMAVYNYSADYAIPSANHENMNHCGCIRYKVIDRDIIAPTSGSSGGNKGSKGKSTSSGGAKKRVSKAPIEWE